VALPRHSVMSLKGVMMVLFPSFLADLAMEETDEKEESAFGVAATDLLPSLLVVENWGDMGLVSSLSL